MKTASTQAKPFRCQARLACSVLALSLPAVSLAREPVAPPRGIADAVWPAVQAAHDLEQHAFSAQAGGGYLACNPGQQWWIDFDGKGFVTRPYSGGWLWGMELRRYGFAGAELPLPEHAAATRAEGGRLSCWRRAPLEEWYVNDQRGLEQGWTLQERPPGGGGTGPLRLELAVRGGLLPVVVEQGVLFHDEAGQMLVKYQGLKAWDATGKALPARFAIATDVLVVEVEEQHAVYPVTIDPVAQQTFLKAGNADADDGFGFAVAMDGDLLVVGAPYEDSNAGEVNGNGNNNALANAGAAYIFARSGTTWTQQAYLKASNPSSNSQFGCAVAVSGDTVAVGAFLEGGSGAVYVFAKEAGAWSQQAYLKASNAGSGDEFGRALALRGNLLMVGAPAEDSAATGINGDQGNNDAEDSGAVYVFARFGVSWTQTAYLKAVNADPGDAFGTAVALSDDTGTLVAGAPRESSAAQMIHGDASDNSAFEAGAAYVFVKDGAAWIQQAYLKGSYTDEDDYFGQAVAIDGDRVVVGAPYESRQASGVNGISTGELDFSGAAYLFERSEELWSQVAYLKAAYPGADDYFGWSVAVQGSHVLVGADYEDSDSGAEGNNNLEDSGAVYLFTDGPTGWYQEAFVKGAQGNIRHRQANFGGSIAVSSGLFAVGAPLDGGVVDYSGTCYVFALPASSVFFSLAKTDQAVSTPGGPLFNIFGQMGINGQGRALFDASLKGSGSIGGRNGALFSTLAGSLELLLQKQQDLSGFAGSFPNTRVAAFNSMAFNHPGFGLAQITLTGTGVTARNNRALIIDSGGSLAPLLRTGQPLAALSNAQLRAFSEVLQSSQLPVAVVRYQLHIDRFLPVSPANDSGLLLLDEAGNLMGSSFDRLEGAPAFGPAGGTFGQFFSRAAFGPADTVHFGAFYHFPDNTAGGKPVQALFHTDLTGTVKGRTAMQGQAPDGTWGALLQTFLGETASGPTALYRATLVGMGVTTVNNEGIWRAGGGGLWLRKGQALGGGMLVKSIAAFWPVGGDQLVARVQLAGAGVTAANQNALMLRQANGNWLMLLRTGTAVEGVAAPGIVAAIQRVEVDPVNGWYAVQASLKGVPSSRNQGLWVGQTTAGDDANAGLRLPQLALRKGDPYNTSLTQGTLRGLEMKPQPNPGGAGGRGLARVVSSEGHVLLILLGDLNRRELVVYRK